MIYRLSFRRRIWMAFMLIVVLAVTAAGWLSYRIAADVVEKNAYRFSQTTLSKTSQVLDEKLNRITSSVYSMMVNTAYRRALGFDSNFTEVENYYTHLSALQATFVQTRLYEPIIHTILVATPGGDYYQTSQSRLFESSFTILRCTNALSANKENCGSKDMTIRSFPAGSGSSRS